MPANCQYLEKAIWLHVVLDPSERLAMPNSLKKNTWKPHRNKFAHFFIEIKR
jgi:hypothetical protein